MRPKDSGSFRVKSLAFGFQENGLGQVGLMTAAKPLHQLGPTAPKGSLRRAVCCNTMYSLKVYSLLSVDKVKREELSFDYLLAQLCQLCNGVLSVLPLLRRRETYWLASWLLF